MKKMQSTAKNRTDVCLSEMRRFSDRAGSLEDVLMTLRDNQIKIANRVAQFRQSFQRALFVATTGSTGGQDGVEMGPTPLDLPTGTTGPTGAANALLRMFPEVLMAGMASNIEPARPSDEDIGLVAQLRAAETGSIEMAFRTWQEGIAARNQSLDNFIVANDNYRAAKLAYEHANYEKFKEREIYRRLVDKVEEAKSAKNRLGEKIKTYTAQLKILNMSIRMYQDQYDNKMVAEDDRVDKIRANAQGKIDAVQNNLDAAQERLTSTEGEIAEAKNVLVTAKGLEAKTSTTMQSARSGVKEMKESAEDVRGEFGTSFMQVSEPDAIIKEAHALEDADNALQKLDKYAQPRTVKKQEAPTKKKPRKSMVDSVEAKMKTVASDTFRDLSLKDSKVSADEARQRAAAAEVDLQTSEAKKTAIVNEIAQFKKELSKVEADVEPQLHLQPKPTMAASMIKRKQNESEARRNVIMSDLAKVREQYEEKVLDYEDLMKVLPTETQKWKAIQERVVKKKMALDQALDEKKRSEMETYIRKESISHILNVFKEVCDRVEDQSLLGPNSKCCRARVRCYNGPTPATGGEGEYDRRSLSSTGAEMKEKKINDSPENMAKMQKELRRLMAQRKEFSPEKKAEIEREAVAIKEKQEAAAREATADETSARVDQEKIRQENVEKSEKEMSRLIADDEGSTGGAADEASTGGAADAANVLLETIEDDSALKGGMGRNSFLEKQLLRGTSRNRRRK
jgi:hypothetical protein